MSIKLLTFAKNLQINYKIIMRYGTIATLTALLLFAACQHTTKKEQEQLKGAETGQPVKSPKNIIRKHISIPSEFNHLTNLGCVDIIYTQGNFNIEVEGDSTMVNYLQANFDSNLLTVSIKSDGNSDLNPYGNTSNVKMYISSPDLRCVSVCGNGNFESLGTWRNEDILLGMIGTGSMKLAKVECTTFSLQSTDGGSFTIANLKADDAAIFSTSTARIEADVNVNNLTVLNEGKQIMKLTGTASKLLVKNPKDPNLTMEVTTPPIR